MKVYDLGQNASMMPRLAVNGPAGAVVRIMPAELLAADGAVDRTSSGGKLAYWQYTLRGDRRAKHGFRNFFTRAAAICRWS